MIQSEKPSQKTEPYAERNISEALDERAERVAALFSVLKRETDPDLRRMYIDSIEDNYHWLLRLARAKAELRSVVSQQMERKS